MKTLTNSIAVIIIFLIPVLSQAQSGPGGVGNSNSMALWLKADAINNLNHNDEVTYWEDLSGNGNHALAPDDNLNTPEYKNTSETINGFPVVYFDGNQTELKVPDSDDLDDTQGLYMMSVANVYQGNDDVKAILGKRYTHDQQIPEYAYDLFYWTGNKLYLDVNNNSQRFQTNTSYSYGNTRMAGFEFDGTRAASQRSEIIVNNEIVKSSSNNSSSIKNSSMDLIIGTMNHKYGKYTEMDFAELIIFQRALNDAEQNIVNNALGAKYELSLAQNDIYDGDDNLKGDYDYDVIGIGKEADGNHNQSSAAGLTIKGNSDLDQNGEYIFAGHKVQNNSLINIASASAADERWERTWYFNNRNVSGAASTTVDLSFDFQEGLGLTLSAANASNFILLKQTAAGSWQAVSSATASINGDMVSFNDVTVNDGAVYTIGLIGTDNSTFPVEMTDFSANKKENKVILNWTTASELNNDYFQLERSIDGQDFPIIGNVQGNGNTNEQTNYSFIDHNPAEGTNYYLIKQMDYDGAYAYHGPVVIRFEAPVKARFIQHAGALNIKLNRSVESMQVRIYAMNGQLMHSSREYGTQTNIPVHGFKKSIYIVHIITGQDIIRQKIYLD